MEFDQNARVNASSAQYQNEDSNVEVRQRKGWKPRKKFPRPPPSDEEPSIAEPHEEQQLHNHVDGISEEDLTQGHPKLQPEDDVKFATTRSPQPDTNLRVRTIAPSRGGKTNIAPSRHVVRARQQQAPPNAVASSYARTSAFREKMPIVRPPAFMRSAPTNPLQGRQMHLSSQ
ncbi:hypothetical protein PIB30_084566 [Stylosanthes scabra]|uniref:Uncharacterized protein n=1 Tax=Stylosanthes scabra TaxID=79078 RepID=A0ABU6XS02_9FABA|nr:hypothetical protein [Stylosanthes scabra]